MLASLLISALLMGLAGTPHCLVMCGASCAAVAGAHRWPFHLARLLSYSMAGAVAAASVGTIGVLAQAGAAVRPLWLLVHLAAMVLGMWLLWRGRQPAWMAEMGRNRTLQPGTSAGAWQVVRGPGRAAVSGLAWVAWPCGLLQSAVLVAALANGPMQGALVMAAFAAASGVGLVLGPALWWRLGSPGLGFRLSPTLAVRLAGLALALASAWAVSHDLVQRFLAWCLA